MPQLLSWLPTDACLEANRHALDSKGPRTAPLCTHESPKQHPIQGLETPQHLFAKTMPHVTQPCKHVTPLKSHPTQPPGSRRPHLLTRAWRASFMNQPKRTHPLDSNTRWYDACSFVEHTDTQSGKVHVEFLKTALAAGSRTRTKRVAHPDHRIRLLTIHTHTSTHTHTHTQAVARRTLQGPQQAAGSTLRFLLLPSTQETAMQRRLSSTEGRADRM